MRGTNLFWIAILKIILQEALSVNFTTTSPLNLEVTINNYNNDVTLLIVALSSWIHHPLD